MAEIRSSVSVKILQTCKIAPSRSSSSADSDFTLPTTFLDTFFFHHIPNERIFFYSLSHSDPPFFESLLPRLKHSLSLALTHFLPLAGNLTWPQNSPDPIILYKPGDAVSFTVAETHADFNRFSANQTYPAIESRYLLPELKASDLVAPAMAIQVTLFPNHGFSIGITTDHATHDGKSSTLFLKAWAFICKLVNPQDGNHIPALPRELIPSFDRTAIKDNNSLDSLYRGYLQRLNGSNSFGNVKSLKFKPNNGITPSMVKGTFELTTFDIEKLRKKVEKWVSGFRLSTFVLTYAYVSSCFIKAEGLDGNKNVCLATFADWRPRSDQEIPLNYFGNGGGPVGIFSKVSDFTDENGIAIIAKKIREEITELEKAASEKKMAELIMQSISKYIRGGQVAISLSICGSPRFGLYEINFGFGKPEKVEFPSINGGNLISLTESRDGSGGVQVGVALPNDTMKLFASLFSEGLKAL